jgi:guanylate kinase
LRRNRGNLFVVSAPSGAGKTTLCQRLGTTLPGIRHSVSYTTRRPRPSEVDGRDYTFVDEAEFRRMAGAGEFAEWAEVHGNLYGTSKRRIEEMLEGGTDVILDIDTQGARKMRDLYRYGVYIFILPPSMKELRERLQGRMSDTEGEIESRLRRARQEIADYKNYDYVIVNEVFEEALGELRAIVVAKRVCTENIKPSWVEDRFLKEEEG